MIQKKCIRLRYVTILLALLTFSACQTTNRSYSHKTYKRPSVTKSSSSSSVSSRSGVRFSKHSYLDDALSQAEREQKLVFVDFYIDRCPPCKLMDEEVFTNPTLSKYMNEHFVSIKINAGDARGANLAQLYRVGAYPTLLFLDSQGEILTRKDGGTSTQHMMDMARSARNGYTAR